MANGRGQGEKLEWRVTSGERKPPKNYRKGKLQTQGHTETHRTEQE